MHIPQTGRGWRASSCSYPACRSTNDHIFSITTPNILLLILGSHNLTCPPFLQRGLSSQQGVSVAQRWLIWAIWLHCRQMLQQQCRHMWLKTQGKMIISKISDNFFHQEPHDLNHWFSKSARLGVRSLREFYCVLMLFNKNDTINQFIRYEQKASCLDNGLGASLWKVMMFKDFQFWRIFF